MRKIESQVDAPIPGQSLTAPLGGRPWQQPPQYNTVEEALEYYVPKMTDRGFVKKLLTIMELGIPLTTIANSIQTASVMEGKHSIDVGVLTAPILVELMKNIGEANEVSYVVGIGQDDMKDKASIALANKKGDINLSDKPVADVPVEKVEEVEPEEELKGLMAKRSNAQ
tara:strand:- start:1063 stop:1569 length:507 start_codon:yes stop_codon:yes gene_type:complete